MNTNQTIKPTLEQEEIFEAFRTHRVLKVNAVAGSGKSSTLRMLAERNNKPSLYVSFNKAIAEEASQKFPSHVECKTTHKIAYERYGRALAHKMKRPEKGQPYKNVAGTPSEIALFYKVQPFYCNESEITPNCIASLARQVVRKYQNSSEEQITKILLPFGEIKALEKNHTGLDVKAFSDIVVKLAKRLWLDRVDPMSSVLIEHDTYLKLWQLSKPVLDYEILYVDEAQDSNPAVLDVIQRQTHCKIVYVGDTYQSIYAFRQAVNAMEMIQAPTKILSKSFRYGQPIADVASMIIDYAIEVKGNEVIKSKVEDVTQKQYTKIYRTNSLLLKEAVELLSKGNKVYCDVDTYDFTNKLKSAEALYLGNTKFVKHQDITPYPEWKDLVLAADEDLELKRVMKIVEKGKVFFYVKALEKLADKNSKYDIFLTTAHKSKGKEWDNVIIANDFPVDKIFTLERKKDCLWTQQEINLMYVACTRAIKTLQLHKDMCVVDEDFEV